MGNIQVAGDKARDEKGAVLSDLRHQKHEHRPDQDGVDEVGGEPHIGADAAHQHKDKADGDAHRSQRAGGDGVLCCPFSVSRPFLVETFAFLLSIAR